MLKVKPRSSTIKTKVSIICFLILSSSLNASNFFEDLVDITSAIPSGGHYLNIRELSERELELELNKRLAKKLASIASETLKQKVGFIKKSISQDTNELNRNLQLYSKTNKAIKLARIMRESIEEKLNNNLEVSTNAKALIQTKDTQLENIRILRMLYERAEAASKDSASEVSERNPIFVYLNESLEMIAEKYQLQTDEVIKLIILNEDNALLKEHDEKYFEQQFILRSFKSVLLSRQKQLERRIGSYENTLDELVKVK